MFVAGQSIIAFELRRNDTFSTVPTELKCFVTIFNYKHYVPNGTQN